MSALGFGGSEIGYEHPSHAAIERLLGGALDPGLHTVEFPAT